MNIQWYPGHMTKAKRNMLADLKLIDIVVEMLDARAPFSTRNPDIDEMAKNKQRLIILNKVDLADAKANNLWKDYFESLSYEVLLLDSRDRLSLKPFIFKIEKLSKEKKERDRKRGILNRATRIMITGIPNVGKSTLINSICGKKSAKTGNKPGVTKANQWIKISNSIELLDTPGILWPKFDNQKVAKNLAFIGSINDMIIDIKELALEFISFLLADYPILIKEKFDTDSTDKYEILEEVAKKRFCLNKGNTYDLEKAAIILINEFRSAKLFNISLEIPNKE